MKSLLKLGKTLNKVEQKAINGGSGIETCVTIDDCDDPCKGPALGCNGGVCLYGPNPNPVDPSGPCGGK